MICEGDPLYKIYTKDHCPQANQNANHIFGAEKMLLFGIFLGYLVVACLRSFKYENEMLSKLRFDLILKNSALTHARVPINRSLLDFNNCD